MRAPLLASLLILAVGSFWGWHESRQLVHVQKTREHVQKEADAFGIFTDPKNPGRLTKNSRRERERAAQRLNPLLDRLTYFGKKQREVLQTGNKTSESEIDEMMAVHELFYSLSANDLKELFAILQTRTELAKEDRNPIENSILQQLSTKDPESALKLSLEKNPSTNDFLTGMSFSNALRQFANDSPLKAIAWFKKEAGDHADLLTEDAKITLYGGIAQKDPILALSLAKELGIADPEGSHLQLLFGQSKTPEQFSFFLDKLREQAKEAPDTGKLHQARLNLYYQVTQSGYDSAQNWVKSANLTPEETETYVSSLSYSFTKQDTGKWLEWLSHSSSESKQISNTTRSLMSSWTREDYAAAGQWLTQAPASPAKEEATVSYIQTIAPYDVEVASQWAETLPDAKQQNAYKTIQRSIKDPAAAAAYAEAHGLKK